MRRKKFLREIDMRRNTVVELRIEKMKFPLIGVGFHEGKRVEIKGAMIGQLVEARIGKKRTNRHDAKMIRVIERAENEVDSFCEHFGNCGGCALQTLSYEEQATQKGLMVKDILTSSHINDFEFKGVIKSPIIYNYRNKMEYTFGDEVKDGPMTLGMHRKGRFNDIVTVDKCHIASEDSNVILSNTLTFFENTDIPKYNKHKHEGFLRHLVVRKATNTGEILIGLSASTQIDYNFDEYLKMLLNLKLDGEIVGFLYIKNDGRADMVQGDYDVIYGRDYYTEKLLDLDFKVSFKSFFQTNTLGAEVLYQTAISMTEDLKSKTVFDLFSGTGTIGQIISKDAKKVIGVELIEDAVKAAKENAELNNITNCEFLAGDVFDILDTIKEKPDVIIVDPPRVGIHEKALKKIVNYGVDSITYISCNPKSLAENLKTMQDMGYAVKEVVCVDMFPHTPHVETVVKLQRK
ncbi:MAG: 23S rRNA (uracil(1939)-C(5))-methyltransferase RlmD [Acidaminobacteraceae bacterium]